MGPSISSFEYLHGPLFRFIAGSSLLLDVSSEKDARAGNLCCSWSINTCASTKYLLILFIDLCLPC